MSFVPDAQGLLFEAVLLAGFLGARAVQRSLAGSVNRLALALGRTEARDAALRAELDELGKAVGTRLSRPLIAARGLAGEVTDAPGVRDLADAVWALAARLDEVLVTAKLPVLPEPPPARSGVSLPTLVGAVRAVTVLAGLVYLLAFLRDGLAAVRVAGLVCCAWMVWSPVEEGRLRATLWPMAALAGLLCWLTGGVAGTAAPLVVLVVVLAGLIDERGTTLLAALLAGGLLVVEGLGAEPVAPGGWLVALVAAVAGALGVRAVLDAKRITEAVLLGAERKVDEVQARWAGVEGLLERVATGMRPEAEKLMDASRTLADGAIERVKTRLGSVVARLARYLELLDELALVSRPVERKSVPLRQVVQHGLADWAALASAKGRTVTLAEGTDDQALTLDARRVEAVVTAAVQNALEAGGNVTLEVTPFTVRVVDDGPGLAPAIAERLFGVGVTTRPTAAGLGLFLARRLAEQQGATLTVRNGERGVRVELTLGS